MDRAEHVAILRLDVPAFAGLSLDDQIAAYYLAKAVWAGRDIAYDQIHPDHVEIRNFLEDIALNIEYGAPRNVSDPFWSYLKLLWIHNGFYDLRSLNLIQPPMQQREFDRLMYLALSNSGGQLGTVTEINFKRNRIVENLLDPALDRALYARKFNGNVDPVGDDVPNFYQDVSAEEVSGHSHRFPANSKLVKRRGKIVELVYRTGDETWAPGPYANHLAQIVEFLENARPYLPPERIQVIDYLLHHFRTGDPASFDSAARIWHHSDASVDFILGFSDTRFDPMGLKGLWTGLLFITDEEAQKRISGAADVIAQQIKLFPPYSKSGRFKPYRGKIKAVQLLAATGCNGPLCPDIYTDPPGRNELTTDSQRLIFTNVISARAKARVNDTEASAGKNLGNGNSAGKYAADIALCEALISNVLNLEDWEMAVIPITDKLPPAAILECVLDKITYLWLIKNPEFIRTGLLPDPAAAEEAYRQFGRDYLLSLDEIRLMGKSITSAATQLIGTYLLRDGGCLVMENVADRKSCRILNYDAMRWALVDLAIGVIELLTNSNESAQENFIAQYFTEETEFKRLERRRDPDQGVFFTDEAFVMPLVEAEINPMGGIKRVYLEQPSTFAEEMFFLRGKVKSFDKTN